MSTRNRVISITVVVGLTAMAQGQTPQPEASCSGAVPVSRAWQEELRCVKILQIEAASRFFNADALVRELLKSKEFQELGYQAVKHIADPASHNVRASGSPSGQLLLRVTRKKFTTRFTVALVSPASQRIYVSEESSSLGGDIEPDLAKSVVKWVLEANGKRPAKKSPETKPDKS